MLDLCSRILSLCIHLCFPYLLEVSAFSVLFRGAAQFAIEFVNLKLLAFCHFRISGTALSSQGRCEKPNHLNVVLGKLHRNIAIMSLLKESCLSVHLL